MTLNELIERLQEIRDSETGAGDLEIRMATQPGYPITETLRGVAGPDEFLNSFEELSDAEVDERSSDPSSQFIWLVSGGQPTSYEENPYAPSWVFEQVQ